MRLALVIPPYIRPTSPPLGPAVLAAFLQANDPDIEVRCFDLNLSFYHSILQAIDQETFSIRLYDWDAMRSKTRLLEAVALLSKTDWPHGSLELYHSAASILLSFENIFNAFMTEMINRLCLDQDVPSRITLFFQELIQPVLNYSPDLFGISVQFNHQIDFAAILLKRFKEQSNTPTVMGGAWSGVVPHPEQILTSPLKVIVQGEQHNFALSNYLDYLLPGEGELGLFELCQMIQGKKEPDLVSNLVYLQDHQISINRPAVIMDLTSIPSPDFTTFNLEQYFSAKLILPLQLSRGCPWGRCAFCTHHHSYLCYRQLPIEHCIEMIQTTKEKYQCHYFNFLDEMIPAKRFQALAESLQEKDSGIFYSAYAKPSEKFSEPLLEDLNRSGCRVIMWGLESANQRILDLMDKGTQVGDVEQVIQRTAKAGIMNLVFVLFGSPTETEEEFLNTVQFLTKNQSSIHTLSMGTFVLTEGSRIHKHPEEFSIILKEQQTDIANRNLTFHALEGMSPETVANLFKEHLAELQQIGLSHRLASYRDHLLLWATANAPEGA
ncbi:MAG: radical SAM protein [Desulfocapsa sp.]|nr:radical SAM protein [Desulfocapsa sp.]